MSGELLPLFPLRVVALPYCSIPLHIFEERYKAMVSLALKEQSEFGIVLAEGRGIVSAGCSVSVDEVAHRYDDGRMDIICVGRRRFRIAVLDREEDVLKARVQYFDDEDSGSTPASRIEAVSAWEQAKPLLPEPQEDRIDPTAPQLGFRLADAVPDLDARQVLLEIRSEEERLKQVAAYFRGYAERLARVTHARRVAPTNGHGGMDPRATRYE
ncbi:MAG: LON peptidase substrate-binding domain-containing protein [Bryobacterales bacterium]|nr:LON peptidase substrate-binding domain-containing protein [Bryobacterales bacterium]